MDQHLSQIHTLWTLVSRAQRAEGTAVRDAQGALLERYGGAIRRYLLGALRDPDAADELSQEFAYRFLNGGLKGVDPNRGRVRDFVKGVLFHLVADFHARKMKGPRQMAEDAPEPGGDCSVAEERDRQFLQSW